MGAFLNARRRLLARYGRPLTLRRLTAAVGPTYAAVSCTGFAWHNPSGNQPDTLVGEMQQQAAYVEILNDEIAAASWPGPPREGDQVIFGDGKVIGVQAAKALYEGETLIGYSIALKGGSA